MSSDAPLPDQAATMPIVDDDTVIDGQSLANVMLMTGLNVVGEPSTVLFRKRELEDVAPDYFRFRGEQGRGAVDMTIWSTLLLRGTRSTCARASARSASTRTAAERCADVAVVRRPACGVCKPPGARSGCIGGSSRTRCSPSAIRSIPTRTGRRNASGRSSASTSRTSCRRLRGSPATAQRRNARHVQWRAHAMTASDLSKLRIDRSIAPVRARRRRWLWPVLAAAGRDRGWRVVRVRAASGHRSDDAGRHDVSVAAVRRSQRDRLRRRAAQGSDRVQGQRPPRVARRCRGLARQGGRGHRAARQSRRRARRRKARKRTFVPRAPRSSRRRPRSATRRSSSRAIATSRPRASSRRRASTRRRRGTIAPWPPCRMRARSSSRRRRTPRNARVSVDYTLIRAPFDGVILSKSANVGDMITPFSSATRVEGRGRHDGRHGHARGRGRRVRIEPLQGQGGAAGGDRARRVAGCALPRTHQPHGADRRSREGDGDDQGQVRRRSIRAFCRR